MPIRGKLSGRDALCPFLTYHTRDMIVCEGVIPGTSDHIHFQAPNDKQIQYTVFCANRYLTCEKYLANMQKYSDPE